MKLENSEKPLLFSETALPDVFFVDFLAQIPGDYLKIYLYIVFLAKYNKDIKLNDLSKTLSLPLKTINDGFDFLEKNNLVTKRETGYIITNLQELTLHKLYSPNLKASPEKIEETSKNKSRSKVIEYINNQYFQGIMGPSWYNDIDLWFKTYNFDEQVMIALFDYCFNRSALHKNYVQKVAEAWGISKIQTYSNEMYDGEYCMYLTEEDQIEPIFWNKNNALYLRSYDFVKCKILYLKIILSEFI